MESRLVGGVSLALVGLTLASGCAWNNMDRADKGTAVGATSGAVAGAVVGGPIGAVVGAGIGAYMGNHAGGGDISGESRSTTSASPTSASPATSYDAALVRDVQQALNDKGYNAGPVDGRWTPGTADAVRRFQQVMGLPVTGNLEAPTLARLGVAPRGAPVSSRGTR